MPSSTMRKKPLQSTITNSNLSRPSLIDTMLLTSTPLRRSPAIQSTTTSTRSATNLTLQQIFKEKNQTYEDMQLLNLTKAMNKKDKKLLSTNKTNKNRSKNRKTIINQENDDDDDDDTDNDEEYKIKNKSNRNKRKTTISKSEQSEEHTSKKLRRTAALNNKRTTKIPIGKSSAGSSDGCTTVDEENEETRLIEQSKLYIEGPGIHQNYKKINEHNKRIGKKIQSLRSHQQIPPTLPSPILTRSNNENQDIIVAPVQTSSPVKIKTASRITFALPPQSASPISTNIFDSIHPQSPQMPPTTTATSIDTQTDDLLYQPILHEKQCQTKSIEVINQLVQTETIHNESVSIGIQYQSDFIYEQHVVCRDLTTCTCVEQLVKTRQFLVDTSIKLQLPNINRSTQVSKQTMTVEESSPSTMVLAKSSLKVEQQIIFEQFISQFNIRYSNIVDETTTHLITDSLDENTPLVCPLTLKVIQATARHLPIISIQWLVASLTHQIIVPSQIYEIFLGDPTYGYHGGFLRSRIPRSQGLFQSIAFRLECPEQHGCQAILADNRTLRELIYLCGGTIVDDLNQHQSSTIIVLCNEIKRKDHIYTAYVKPEWLLASIAQYNLQPFQQFSVHFSS
ncbi:unnamed protein product [Rotaria sp. Silwood1]|nr:unnamed protein product [Rotaria sp. Silwood1]CAF1220718.1 unnamed protein product [Rotaria sp. Silwood1]CAF3482680.1 unnamed protein product [Rotaria sp. Silwood1]CAF3510356.1 unnamed protein product [Rotaria sp. Silwood1]CAF3510805.1 unnamed protein product [Rotaria sp. Silwood1]